MKHRLDCRVFRGIEYQLILQNKKEQQCQYFWRNSLDRDKDLTCDIESNFGSPAISQPPLLTTDVKPALLETSSFTPPSFHPFQMTPTHPLFLITILQVYKLCLLKATELDMPTVHFSKANRHRHININN